MKIMVVGAYGRIGQVMIREAVKRGMDVTGVAHRAHDDVELGIDQVLVKDVTALTAEDVAGYDAVVDAVGGWDETAVKVLYNATQHLVKLLKGTDTRYLKVGGANTLYIDDDHDKQLQELSTYFPPEYKVLCDSHKKALEILRTYSDVAWTYLTPCVNFDADGEATGVYHVEGEEFTPEPDGDNGKNDYISYADFATATMDFIEKGQYLRQRVTLIHGDKPAA